jgi:hypothetical protein
MRTAMDDQPSWSDCSRLLHQMTDDERAALKAMAKGEVRSVSADQLGQLKAMQLVYANSLKLTPNGYAVLAWC